MNNSDYQMYRGKCKELSEEQVRINPSLRLVRGHYHCPIWGEQAHWWCVKPDGTIVDPSKLQFPSKGIGEYVEFNGKIKCAECNKEVMEEDAIFEGRYGFCSSKCVLKFVGL